MYRSTKVSKKTGIVVIVILLVLVIGAIVAYALTNKYSSYKDKVDALVFEDIDLALIADGVYTGEYDSGVIFAKVEVGIEDGTLTYINLLEHRHEQGAAAEIIVEHMVEEQRTDVDAISSATYSSKVIRKAVENALTGNHT
ncbi:MAG: FMN-binding protein [Oscillospiraceae bacterium]|nr:FMN-binding protein [Oscillospiraceae bacterium]